MHSSLFSEESDVAESTSDASGSTQEVGQIETLAGTLEQEVKAHFINLLRGLGVWITLSLLGLVLFDYARRVFGEEWGTNTGILIMLLVFGGATAGLIYSLVKPRKRRRELAAILAKQDDVRSIGTLIDIMNLEDGKMSEIARDALIRLLPRLKASDALLLTDNQRMRLRSVLSLACERPGFNSIGYTFRRADDPDTEFRIAILKAFQQIGDTSALAVVTRLANKPAKTEAERRLQKAAQACLPALQEFVKEESNRKTLLRAAEASDNTSETLLRAAAGASSTDPGQLLRPSQPEPYSGD